MVIGFVIAMGFVEDNIPLEWGSVHMPCRLPAERLLAIFSQRNCRQPLLGFQYLKDFVMSKRPTLEATEVAIEDILAVLRDTIDADDETGS